MFRKFMPKKLKPMVRKKLIKDRPFTAKRESANTTTQLNPVSPAFRKVPPTVPSLK